MIIISINTEMFIIITVVIIFKYQEFLANATIKDLL